MITPRLPPAEQRLVDDNGRPSATHRRMLQTMNDQAKAVKTQADTTQTQATATQAQLTATDATVAAHWLYTQLLGSYVTGCTITGHDAGANVLISISSHSRQYISGAVAVNSGSVTDAYAARLWIYYDDPTHVGGAVTYGATSSYESAFVSAAHPNRHYVGAILTPAALAADTTGEPCRPPAYTFPA